MIEKVGQEEIQRGHTDQVPELGQTVNQSEHKWMRYLASEQVYEWSDKHLH